MKPKSFCGILQALLPALVLFACTTKLRLMRPALLALCLLSFSSITLGGTFVAFGPVTYVRSTGAPVTVVNTFTVLDPTTAFTLTIANSGISSASVMLNGAQIFGPADFNKKVTSLSRPVTLQGTNQLAVELASQPGSSFTLKIVGVDNAPPTITASATPPPNAAGWNKSNVTVTFTCSDKTSGVASCSSPVTVTTEGANQLVTGTAVDNAGNTATTSMRINLDETPPSVTITSPRNDELFSTPSALVQGTVSDNLSGVPSVFVNGVLTPITNGAFQTTMPLPAGANALTVTATDRAGNVTSVQRSVLYSSVQMSRPSFLSIPPTVALVGKIFQYQVHASSADAIHRVFSLSVAPTGMTIDTATGVISWTPAPNQAGNQSIAVVASDSLGQGTQSFVLSVFDARPVNSALVSATAGGSITVDDPTSSINGLTIAIPPGALAADTMITVSELIVPSTLGGTQRFLLKGVSIEPDGTALAVPATITVPYATSEFKANQGIALEDFLRMYYLNPSNGSLAGLKNLSLDTANHALSATVPHFSTYVVTNVFRLCPPPTSQSDCPSAVIPPALGSLNIPVVFIHGFQFTFNGPGMGDESTWGQLRYMLNAVDDHGAGRVDAWRFDWDSNFVSFGAPAWFEQSAANLERSINAVAQLSGQGPVVNLLAHSFGGLVARAYLQGVAAEGGTSIPFQDDVSKVMTLGTPHRGIGGDYAGFLADACALTLPFVQPDTCYESNTGDPQFPGQGDFLNHLNTLPLPLPPLGTLAEFDVVRGQTLDLVGGVALVVDPDDGLITTTGSDFCAADPAIPCGTGGVTDQIIATSISDKVGLCHSGSLFGVTCAAGLNVAMAAITDKTHPLWQEICIFLGGDPTKCKPQLKVTISPSAPPGGTVTSDLNNPGIACGITCASAYDPGTQVTLTATPISSDYSFSAWSGDCSGSGTCIVTMNNDKAVTATFTCINPSACGGYVLSVTKIGSGTGTVTSSPAGINCGSTCIASFAPGASVILTAVPALGSVFNGWGGACASAGANLTAQITLSGSMSCAATFSTNTSQFSGTIDSIQCSSDPYGSTLIVTGTMQGPYGSIFDIAAQSDAPSAVSNAFMDSCGSWTLTLGNQCFNTTGQFGAIQYIYRAGVYHGLNYPTINVTVVLRFDFDIPVPLASAKVVCGS